MITNWGYELPEINSLPDMLTMDDFNDYTGGKFGDTDRIEREITAACSAIRNFVGWHLFPPEACKMRALSTDRRITRVGCDLLIQLPARVVTEVDSIKVNDVSYASYFCDQNGLLRVFNVPTLERTAIVEVEYTAGITDEMIAPIEELISHRVTHAVAVPEGITQEASGGVSVTYNANWINNSRATALAGDNKELLVPYKVMGVF